MKQLESLFWGIIAALGALVIEFTVLFIFDLQNFSKKTDLSIYLTLPHFILIAAFVEETFKYLVIAKIIENISIGKTFITNSIFVGLGFFITEMAFMLLSSSSIKENFYFLLEIILIHGTIAGFIGYKIATKNPRLISVFASTVFWATIIHFAYNLMATNRNELMSYVIYFLIVIMILVNVFNIFRIEKELAA